MRPDDALEEPEEREEGVVDDAKRDRGRERRPLRALDGDELRHELAEEDMAEREDGEGRRRRPRCAARASGGRPGARQHGRGRARAAIAGSPIQPSPRLASVMPNCVTER